MHQKRFMKRCSPREKETLSRRLITKVYDKRWGELVVLIKKVRDVIF
jgi:hypothetical protein